MKKRKVPKKTKIPEALGNRLCGLKLYIFILVLNACVHITLFFLHEQTVQSSFRLFLSFIFFIYPLHYLADTLWALRPSVRNILSGKILINRKYYMNTVQKEISRNALLPVTVSIPVYTESNAVIFKTISESIAAIRHYKNFSGLEANIVISDDGLAPLLGGRCSRLKAEQLVSALRYNPASLADSERMAAERIEFYRENNIAFVVRPASGRAGLFKKASNLNYTHKLCSAIEKAGSAENLFIEGGDFAGGYAEGSIVIHDIILLLDKDSGVPEKIIEAILPEFAADKKLAYVQCAAYAENLNENYYTQATGRQVNNLFHNIWPCKALQGFFVPLVGHDVFIRKSVLEKSGLWPENRVSEDYDKAICFYGMGYHGKYAQLKGLEFTECASRSFVEETGKQRRYAYGLFEMIFDGTISPGKARACDVFYMLLYFCSVINEMLLLPSVLLESYFGNTHLIWVGFIFCVFCFVVIPIIRSLLMRRLLPRELSDNFISTLIMSVSFVGHSFSFLAGGFRFIVNKFKKITSPFPSTNVDALDYSFRGGIKIIYTYIRKNLLLIPIFFLCLDRGIFMITVKGMEPMTVFSYAYIMFCTILVPVILTPQLFGGFGRREAVINAVGVGRVASENYNNTKTDGAYYQRNIYDSHSTTVIDDIHDFPETIDRELFLADYHNNLLTSLSAEEMPEELLENYVFDSCLKKDSEGKKALYILHRKSDGAKALLRVTKDYPEEDALEEAKLLNKLNHPCIPKVYFSCEQNGKKYLVREFIEGRSLFDIVSTGGALSAKDIFGIALKLSEILQYLHSQTPPVIHRDLKPQNIIVDNNGNIHLIDFGIARVHKQERRQDTSVVLTLDYASPEQYGFEQTTPLSDIYSLGVVLLFLATGRTLRYGLEAQIVNNKLRNLIELCIAFNPKARIQSAEAISNYIKQAGSLHDLKKRHRVTRAAGAIVAVVLISALAYGLGFAFERRGAQKQSYEVGYTEGYRDGYSVVPIFRKDENTKHVEEGTVSANMALSNGAFAARSDENIFYTSSDGIWRMSASAAEAELFVQNDSAEALSYYNGWLYYTSSGRILQTNIYTQRNDLLSSAISGKLYVLGERFFIHAKNGLYELWPISGETALLKNIPECKFLSIIGDELYYIDPQNHILYRSNLGEEDKTALTDTRCESFCIYGDNIFCSLSDGELMRMNLNGEEETRLFESKISMLNISEDGIFFLDKADGLIKRLSFDGRILERVSGNTASDFNIVGGWVFYHNKNDGNRLWCVRIDGSNDHPVIDWR